jgi:serine/threonine protein kinase
MSDALDTPTEDPLVGQVIQERFRVEKKLGQGGMGAIYLAEHLLLKKLVAIKCLHAGLASNPDVVRRFKNEAVAASSIGHPNIVEVMDMGRFDDGTFYMVLEYLEGQDFQEELDAQGPQSVERVAHVGVQVCAALGAAAKKGIVHRDLKPENIFLVRRHGDDAFVKVLDFGISKILDGSGGATKTGELMGTPYYMAPEQVLGDREVTHLADVYALGVIFYQALCGKVPFDGNALAQIIMKIATQPAPVVVDLAPHVPAGLSDLVSRMMSKDPAERPQSFHEVARGLGPFLSQASPFAQPGALEKLAPSPVLVSRSGLEATQLGTAQAPQVSARASLPGANSDAPTAPRLSKWMLGAGAALFLVIVGFSFSGSDEETPSAIVESKTVANPSKEGTENENEVRVEISTVPADAKIFLDGKALDNPFSGVYEKDLDDHELLVTRAGYKDERRKMLFTTSQTVVIPLSQDTEKKEGKTSTSPASKAGTESATTSSTKSETGSQSRPAQSSSPRPASGSSSRSHTPPKPIRDLERGLKNLF